MSKTKTAFLLVIACALFLSGCCFGGNEECIGFPAPWLWVGDGTEMGAAHV
jgi:hypothetical protein